MVTKWLSKPVGVNTEEYVDLIEAGWTHAKDHWVEPFAKVPSLALMVPPIPLPGAEGVMG